MFKTFDTHLGSVIEPTAKPKPQHIICLVFVLCLEMLPAESTLYWKGRENFALQWKFFFYVECRLCIDILASYSILFLLSRVS